MHTVRFTYHQVEISTGRGSDDFYLAVNVDGYNPVKTVATGSSRVTGSLSSTVFKAVLRKLSPNTDYSVRVSAATRLTWFGGSFNLSERCACQQRHFFGRSSELAVRLQ